MVNILWLVQQYYVVFRLSKDMLFLGKIILLMFLFVVARYTKSQVLSKKRINPNISSNMTTLWMFTVAGLFLVIIGSFCKLLELDYDYSTLLKVGVTISIINWFLVGWFNHF